MKPPPKNYSRVVVIALMGLALVGTGLSLAVLSNPKRFSINAADDQYIALYAISGFACTLLGVLLFLYAIRDTTKTMPPKLRSNANIGVGLGFVLQLAGLFMQVPRELRLALILSGLAAFVWGGMHYAHGKGYSRSLGLLAFLGVLGLVVLTLLPHQESDPVVHECT